MADVVGFIKNYITFSDASTVPAFRLKDLTDMYKKQMVLHGAPAKETETVHATRFKGEILELVPGVCEVEDVKYALLTLDSDIGCALFEACQSSKHDDEMILAKAVAIVRR